VRLKSAAHLDIGVFLHQTDDCVPRQTKLPLHLERIMLKLLDGATFKHDSIQKRHRAQWRLQMFLVYVERALGDGSPLSGQRKLRSIMRKLRDFEDT
jgi:hypothetical protein